MKDISTIVTNDGSSSLFSTLYNSSYHSIHGALQESNHIFIKYGLDHYCQNDEKTSVSILEYGMGTGLNVLLALLYSIEHNVSIDFHTIEKHPVNLSIIDNLEFPGLNDIENKNLFAKIHQADWDKEIILSEHFKLTKHHSDFNNYHDNHNELSFDIVFYDCFGPGSQPDLWELPFLQEVYNQMSPNSILTTFCAKGSFKRHLKSLDLIVEALPGPPGKREITRAVKL